MIFIGGSFSFLGFRLYRLQIEKNNYYTAKVEAQKKSVFAFNRHRGIIYFKDKNNNFIPAAVNRPRHVIFAAPKDIDDVEETANFLTSILELDVAKLKTTFTKDSFYELLARYPTSEQVAKVQELGLMGVYVEEEEARFYSFNNLASQVLGFVGPAKEGTDFVGKYGLELFYNNQLSGQNFNEDSFYSTIDFNIQTKAEEVLRELATKYQSAGGSVIIQEPKTGKILAMAGYPDFDPNNYSQAELSHFLNPNVENIYEPGSDFKVLTMAAGIDSGAITPETTYYDNGDLAIKDRVIKNWDLKAHGLVTMTQVIEQSINTGAAFAEKQTGHKRFYDYLIKFGFSRPTQINLPGELPGSLDNLSGNNPVNFATASFGQGISVTPIQLINAISAIANNGRLMRPLISDKDEPEELEVVVSPEAAQKTTAMMESALKKAEIGHIDKYRLAGKTGTAQVPDFKRGGYTKEVINTYVGFGPVSDPKFVILIKLDKPAGAPLAGQTVVPAFRELAQFIIDYYNIPPDELSD
jgi:cell division protein FtsI/penicillin-binding protein 2